MTREITVVDFQIGENILQVRNSNGEIRIEFQTRNGQIFEMEKHEIKRLNDFLTELKAETESKRSDKIKSSKKFDTGKRYNKEQKEGLIAGFNVADNKTRFCEENMVSMMTIHRWIKQEKTTKLKSLKPFGSG